MSFSSTNFTAQQFHSKVAASASNTILTYDDTHLLERMFKALPDVVSIYDVEEARVIYSNRSLAPILGYDENAVTEFQLHPYDLANTDIQFQRVLKANDDEPIDVRYRLKQANGRWKWFTDRQVVFKRHADGTVAQILKTTRDIQKEHKSADEWLYFITEYNLPNFALMLFDHDLRYTLATGILLRRLGFLRHDMEGHTLRETVSDEIAEWLEPAYRAALEGYEITLERLIGDIIVSIQCLPVRNEIGEITAGMVLAEDITDRQQAMAALIESEQRFAQFSENMNALFWMVDEGNRKPLYFSSAFKDILGVSAEEVLDDLSVLISVVHPEDQNVVRSTFRETFVTGRHEIKFRIVSPSGQIRWLLSRAFPIYDDKGKLYRIAGIAEDITRQTEMEAATFNLALEQERMQLLSRFIGTTSHELRTPLTIIPTSLYLLRKANDPTKVDERLGIIETQVAQLGRLVGQMHMLLRVESIGDGRSDNPVSLNKLLGKLEQNLSPSVIKKELTLELVFGDDLPNLYVDSDLLLPALQNVFENAINYTDAGRIRVQTSVIGSELVLTVEDTGIGISEEDLPHIFERFYKVEKEKKRTTVAAGLGLAITKRIMELTGGHIEAESHLGQGSTFRLSWSLSV